MTVWSSLCERFFWKGNWDFVFIHSNIWKGFLWKAKCREHFEENGSLRKTSIEKMNWMEQLWWQKRISNFVKNYWKASLIPCFALGECNDPADDNEMNMNSTEIRSSFEHMAQTRWMISDKQTGMDSKKLDRPENHTFDIHLSSGCRLCIFFIVSKKRTRFIYALHSLTGKYYYNCYDCIRRCFV